MNFKTMLAVAAISIAAMPTASAQGGLKLTEEDLQAEFLKKDIPSGGVGRHWRGAGSIRDLSDPCQPTAYLCPKAEDGNRRKSVLQRARQRSG
jgi:hypothetical protein